MSFSTGILLGIAVAAEHLHGVAHHLLHGVGDEGLHDGAVLAHHLAGVHLAHAVVHEDARRLGLDGHVGQHLPAPSRSR